MANRKIKTTPDIGARVSELFYSITHSATPLGIREIELMIRHESTKWPRQSAERHLFVREMQDKAHEFFITNSNT